MRPEFLPKRVSPLSLMFVIALLAILMYQVGRIFGFLAYLIIGAL